MKKYTRKPLPENVQMAVTFQSKTLFPKSNVKDKTYFYHQSNFVYYGKRPNQAYAEYYIRETDHITKEIIIGHNRSQ